MLDYRLSARELAELREAHRAARNAREAYRLNAVILLGSGWTATQVAEALLIEPDSVRNWFKRYRDGGLDALIRLNYVGREALLAPEQLTELKAHLDTQLQLSAAAVARWGVEYTVSGMTALVHRLGYATSSRSAIHRQALYRPVRPVP
jgi:transposase